MKITIERNDLCTKKKLAKILKMNRLWADTGINDKEYIKGWNQCIDQLIEVMERDG